MRQFCAPYNSTSHPIAYTKKVPWFAVGVEITVGAIRSTNIITHPYDMFDEKEERRVGFWWFFL